MQIYYKGNVTSSTIIRQKVVFNLLMLQSCMEALELRKVQVARKQASLRAATFSPYFYGFGVKGDGLSLLFIWRCVPLIV